MDDLPQGMRRSTAPRLAPMAAALAIGLGLAGCKWLEKGPATSDAPLRKPGAIVGSSQPAKSSAGPVNMLDGSAAGGSPTAPNAPAIQGAPVLAGPGANAGSNTLAVSPVLPDQNTSRQKTGETDKSDPDQAGGSITQAGGSEGESEGAEVVQAEEREFWTAGADREATGTLKTPIEFEDNGSKVAEGEVAATVNGVPIFSDDIIKEINAQNYIAQLKAAPPEVYRAKRVELIKSQLKQFEERELLLQELKKKHKPEQIAAMSKQMDQHFDKEYLPQEIKNAKVNTVGELDLLLQKGGSSIETLRTLFRNRQMARVALDPRSQVKEGFDRPDVLEYYREHLEKYAIPAKAKWEQIQLKFSSRKEKTAARKKAEEIVTRLQNGESFAAVAKECSQGPTAAKGGAWPWTTKGSMAEGELNEAIFKRPVGEISEPIETAHSVNIIRVVSRTEAGYQPFEEVQEDIKTHLRNSLGQKQIEEFLQQLRENAAIEDFTDRL